MGCRENYLLGILQKAGVSLTSIKSPVCKKGSKQEYWDRLIVNGPVLLPSSDLNVLDLTTSPCGTPSMAKCIQACTTKIM
eukprot:10657511-Ditylum_brightwellii.AAC.1